MLQVLRTQVDVVLADGAAVLNGDDERVAALARLCDGEVMLYALDAAAAAAHRAAGGARCSCATAIACLQRRPKPCCRAGAAVAAGRTLAPEALLRRRRAAWALGLRPT